jgi:hypothetical protein
MSQAGCRRLIGYLCQDINTFLIFNGIPDVQIDSRQYLTIHH